MIDSRPWFDWMEDAVKTMYEDEPECIVLAARMKNGDTITAHYAAGAEDLARFCCHIYADVIMKIIEDNAEHIREILDGGEDDPCE